MRTKEKVEEFNRNRGPDVQPVILPCPDDDTNCQETYPKLAADLPATPCGLIAKSVFNDTFRLCIEGASCENEQDFVAIDKTNIAWASDIQFRFNNLPNDQVPDEEKSNDCAADNSCWKDVQWLDMTDPDFIVWMRTAGLPNFRKLWGRVDAGLTA